MKPVLSAPILQGSVTNADVKSYAGDSGSAAPGYNASSSAELVDKGNFNAAMHRSKQQYQGTQK